MLHWCDQTHEKNVSLNNKVKIFRKLKKLQFIDRSEKQFFLILHQNGFEMLRSLIHGFNHTILLHKLALVNFTA
jgi:hypothetical protein